MGYKMQKEITVEEIEQTINKYTKIDEPIIVKRENKEDLIIISMEEYKKTVFLSELEKKIEEGEQDIKNNKIHNAKKVFDDFRSKYDTNQI